MKVLRQAQQPLYAIVCALFVLLLLFQIGYANRPTVTATSVDSRGSSLNIKGYWIYQYTFAVTPAALDTAVLYLPPTATAANSSIVNWASADSVVRFEFSTTEATADSIDFAFIHQISGKASPTTDSDWTRVRSNNAINDAISGVELFAPKRYGLFYRYRCLVAEDTTGSGSSEQGTGTNTVRVTIPLQ